MYVNIYIYKHTYIHTDLDLISGDRSQGDGGGERPVRLHKQRVHLRDAHHQEAGRGGGRRRRRRQRTRLALKLKVDPSGSPRVEGALCAEVI